MENIELLIILTIFVILAGLNVIVVIKFVNKKKLTLSSFAAEYSDRFLDILTAVITILRVNRDKYESEADYEQAIIEAAAKEIVDTYKDSLDAKYGKIFNQELIEDILATIIEKYNLLEDKDNTLD